MSHGKSIRFYARAHDVRASHDTTRHYPTLPYAIPTVISKLTHLAHSALYFVLISL